MKRCPECRRDYYDDTLSFCLADGSELVYGLDNDAPAKTVLSEPRAVANGFPASEAPTKRQIHATDQTAIVPRGAEAEPQGSRGAPSEKQSFSARRAAEPKGRRIVVTTAVGIAVLLLVGGFLGYQYFAPVRQIESIAVMPFENKSSDADTDYLSDGLAESLIYRLSQLPDLKVSPTSSVFRYKGKETDPQLFARELGVDSVMTGRITKRGDSLTISVNLVDTRNGKSLWGEHYERDMSELLITQREIANEITNNLKLKLSGESEQKLAKKYTDSNEAYQLYLKGHYHFAKRTKDDIFKAIEYYRQAVALDPNFALAYARIGECYVILPSYPYMSAEEAVPQGRAAIRRALEIDPNLAEAHVFLAYSLAVYDWNWTEAEREFKKAIELDPNNSDAHYRYGFIYLAPVGRFDEAISEMNRALEIEPLNLTMNANLAAVYYNAGQKEKALEQAKKTYELDPNHMMGRSHLGFSYNATGMHREAIALSEKVLESEPTNQDMLMTAGYAYAKSGRRNDAEQILARFKTLAQTEYVSSYSVAYCYAALGDKDKAFAELERAFADRDWVMHRIKFSPFMESLRDDPRFKDLLRRMNLPE